MFNKSGITRTAGAAPVQILANADLQYSVGVVVKKTDSLSSDSTGKIILQAGTPLFGDLNDRTAPFVVANGANATGILLHDVDITSGKANATLLLFGFVNLSRINPQVVELITEDVIKSLPMIKFFKC